MGLVDAGRRVRMRGEEWAEGEFGDELEVRKKWEEWQEVVGKGKCGFWRDNLR